ncbi:hypothetical protein DCC39_09060 [Pueribacillus theae]|uniref:SGNH/GDSL hydrolase family protein n=1 Tax=Pueribacillus theae TaxID=2171751 RepID=A0A2U1K2N1_9BACI|nr:DUF1574 family protein [Pueribacillus theae]PWA11780.1 hypothetical protein DCC39_09060 [Pueribacillus theae]
MSWKRMAITVILASLFITGGVMALNYAVNPLGKYKSHVLPSLVWTGRSDKAALLENFEENPDVLILGSSRSMKLDPDFIKKKTGLTSFNAGVNSAQAEDYYVMLRYALEDLKVKPKIILLGIDVEAFHNTAPIDERLLFNNTLAKYLKKEDKVSLKDKLTALLSYDETAGTVRSLYYAATDYPDPSTSYDKNGFLHYSKKEDKVTEDNYDAKIEDYIEKYRDRFKGYTRLSENRQEYFTDFLRIAKENDIEVVSFITTLHDDLINDLRKTRGYDEISQKLVAYLNDLEAEYNNFTFENFDRVKKYDGSLTAFYDGAHIQEKNANLITEKLLKKIPKEKQTAYTE